VKTGRRVAAIGPRPQQTAAATAAARKPEGPAANVPEVGGPSADKQGRSAGKMKKRGKG